MSEFPHINFGQTCVTFLSTLEDQLIPGLDNLLSHFAFSLIKLIRFFFSRMPCLSKILTPLGRIRILMYLKNSCHGYSMAACLNLNSVPMGQEKKH